MISRKPRITYIQDQYTAFHDAELKNYSEQINDLTIAVLFLKYVLCVTNIKHFVLFPQ